MFTQSALKKSYQPFNDVHLKDKTLETAGKSYTSLWKSAISKMIKSQLSDWE